MFGGAQSDDDDVAAFTDAALAVLHDWALPQYVLDGVQKKVDNVSAIMALKPASKTSFDIDGFLFTKGNKMFGSSFHEIHAQKGETKVQIYPLPKYVTERDAREVRMQAKKDHEEWLGQIAEKKRIGDLTGKYW
jgi:hypothetical protein